MKTAREAILSALTATRPAFPRRSGRFEPPAMPEDPASVLRARIEAAGGRFQPVTRRAWVAQVEWPIELEGAGAADASIYSALPELATRGTGLSDPTRPDFARLDLCVLRGEFAVVENGAVWHVPRGVLERRAALLAEHLVVVVEGDALVASLHHAYDRIELDSLAFGWFLCGPSKTADIEQALVLGAHGPRSLRLVWIRDDAGAGGVQPM